MSRIPIFSSHYSGSILTFDTPEDAVKYNKKSVFTLCQRHGIERPLVVEKNMTGFMELFQNAEKCNIFPRFGLKYWFRHDCEDPHYHRIIVFLKNMEGYKNLIRIHNRANIENEKVISPKILAENWSDNLQLVIPFYDSYIFNNNVLANKACLPEFEGIQPVFFEEDNGLPFDSLIAGLLPEDAIKVKSIYYERRSDFPHWMTYKCALNYSVKGKNRTLEEPNFDHLHSHEFCLQSLYEEDYKD